MPGFQMANPEPDLTGIQHHQLYLKVWTYEMYALITVEITDRLYMKTVSFLNGKD